MRWGPRWLRAELHDRMLIKRGHVFGRTIPEVTGGEPSGPGDLERYFDSHITGPGLLKWRHYFPAYERHLAHLRGQAVHLVEIGVFSGGSLPMWRAYLGPDSRITGVDIDPACQAYEAEGISIVIGDQGDAGFWHRFLAMHNQIDVLIDDGSHRPADQIVTLTAVLPRLRPGGVYICEDAHFSDNEFSRFVDGLARNIDEARVFQLPDDGYASDVTPFQRAVASIHRYPFMTVIERTRAAVTRFECPRHGTQWKPAS